MTRKEQLQDLWDALLRGGFVSSKKEMAQRLGITYHSLSAAFSRLRGRDCPIFTPKK